MKILLVHDEMLNETLPVFAAHPDLTRVFVLDPAFVTQEAWSLKRVQFIIDCLSEIANVRVFHGSLLDVCDDLGVSEIVTQETPNHAIQEWLTSTQRTIEWEAEPQFVEFRGKLSRFTAYWKSVAPQWFSEAELRSLELRK